MTYRPLIKGQRFTAEQLREKIHPGKSYQLILKNGVEIFVKVTSVDSTRVYGTSKIKAPRSPEGAFEDSFIRLASNTSGIAERKVIAANTTIIVVIFLFVSGILIADPVPQL
jgi:hypothetical protein